MSSWLFGLMLWWSRDSLLEDVPVYRPVHISFITIECNCSDEVRSPMPGSVRYMASLPGEAQRGRCLQDCHGASKGNREAVQDR